MHFNQSLICSDPNKDRWPPVVTFESVPVQENLGDKLRPISLAITHTIKPVPPRRHSGSKRLEKLAPILNVSPSNTLHSEVSGRD